MRILHTSDWHLGRSLEQISRIEEQRAFIDLLVETCEDQKVDLVLVAGDIYDTYNPPASAEELFYEALERLSGKGKRAVVVIAGNHDNPERLCAASPLAYKNGIILLGYPASDAGEYKTGSGILVTDSGPGWLELALPCCDHHAIILTLPYPSESRLEEVLSREADEAILQKAYSDKIGELLSSGSRRFREDTVNLIVAHIFMMGGRESDSERTLQVGGALTVDPDVLPSGAHYAALGHLHRPQEVRRAPCPAFYSGSPLAYSFSEAEHSKAVYLVEALPGKETRVTPIYLNCGKPLRRWVAEEGYGQALTWCEEGRDKDAWVDLVIVTDRILTLDEQKRLRSLHPGIINIRPQLKDQPTTDTYYNGIREGKKIDELFMEFYRSRMGVEIPDDVMQAFLEIVNDQDEEVKAGEADIP
ncbi:MAG: exonuclease SbcCD subunit D [Clostridiaceae bacterium]|nr:exonuclease SbcCD subunit D [Bacillota bacterium]NLI38685.1 exonuclease SbcCD subunit D [Clostridiaceae bacterium]